jgi:hypothetical protein
MNLQLLTQIYFHKITSKTSFDIKKIISEEEEKDSGVFYYTPIHDIKKKFD